MLRRLLRTILAERRSSKIPTLETIQAALSAGRLEEAEALCETALRAEPDARDILHVAGVIAYQRGDNAKAISHLQRAAAGEDPQVFLGLGFVLQRTGRLDDAIPAFSRAAELRPDLFDARIALGNALHRKGRLGEAEKEVRAALVLRPDSLEAFELLTLLLYAQARHAEARTVAHRVQQVRRTDGRSVFLALLVPAVYQSREEIADVREELLRTVQRLMDGPPLRVSNPVSEIGISPFYLAYHGQNDRELQQHIAQLCRKAYQPVHGAALSPRQIRSGERIRIGFVSEHFNSHSVGRMNHAFVARMRRDLFEVTVFSLRRHDDALAQRYRVDCDHFIEFDGRQISDIERSIFERRMDVLFFTDVGMDPLTYFLAYSRLAPLQLVSWGHPVTTGIDTLDAFVSADRVETPDADSHYTEQLIRLPCAIVPGYERPAAPQSLKPRAFFGLSDDAHVYACPQAPFKIHPDFDAAIGEVLRSDPRGEVVLVEAPHPHMTQILRQRFERSIPDVARRIRILPHMPYGDYLNLIAVSDVMLDPFHFGGGNTNFESLAMGVPVVTMPPEFLRGRFARGCYEKMDMRECIAHSVRDYVETAHRLANEPEYRRMVSEKIRGRCEVLYGDLEMVTGLESYLTERLLNH